jgi:hypothetical protein
VAWKNNKSAQETDASRTSKRFQAFLSRNLHSMVKKKVDLNHDGVDDGVNSGEFLH